MSLSVNRGALAPSTAANFASEPTNMSRLGCSAKNRMASATASGG